MGKTREPSPSASSSASSSDAGVPITEPVKKRKRTSPTGEELEIDVNLPEPPSKKALRKAKKAKNAPEGTAEGETATATAAAPSTILDPKQKSESGIWIGNLPFNVDKLAVRLFFTRTASIPDANITRVHMPTPQSAPPGRPKPANKGFAYLDFSTVEDMEKAIAVSDTLLSGRKVLIKDARSFQGRPEKATATAAALGLETSAEGGAVRKDGKPAMPPSKRVFVGNLGFDVTKDELDAHFSQAGEIQDVHMATFEDTGKCKGFAWVRFAELEAAEAAVKGFVFKVEDDGSDEDAESSASSSDSDSETEKKPKKAKKQQKRRKWFINRLQGRTLRCEFAEDASTRYKKRFGKAPREEGQDSGAAAAAITEVQGGNGDEDKPRKRLRGDKDERQEMRRKKHVDARKIRPGMALANAPRASGAIVEGTGKKISFD